jgi:DnaJ-class molecular chaperone
MTDCPKCKLVPCLCGKVYVTETWERCPRCGGTGLENSRLERCWACQGSGWRYQRDVPLMPCPRCMRTGRHIRHGLDRGPCQACNGKGELVKVDQMDNIKPSL